ncbi:hypothetical protein [Reticulibacter mediterranei]|uniref:hypothetical protein n=1 Tax=Reticulibacter mediterranei TaxID=2778369 RepID=UPI001C690AE2|nr:hypothetical protein [Reticulibacter mediterranei]
MLGSAVATMGGWMVLVGALRLSLSPGRFIAVCHAARGRGPFGGESDKRKAPTALHSPHCRYGWGENLFLPGTFAGCTNYRVGAASQAVPPARYIAPLRKVLPILKENFHHFFVID